MHLQESGEMYLEAIWVLTRKDPAVRSLQVAEYLGFSKPSVSRAVGLLKEGGYLFSDGGNELRLTPKGQQVARNIYERHTLLTQFLISLGVSPVVAAEDACKMEHDISDESFEALKRHFKSFEK